MSDSRKDHAEAVERAQSFHKGDRIIYNGQVGTIVSHLYAGDGFRVRWDDGREGDVADARWVTATTQEPSKRDLAHARWRSLGEPTAAAMLVLYDGEILVERGSKGNLPPGLPGGKREVGERVIDCACRELEEETGLYRIPRSSAHLLDVQAGDHFCSIFWNKYKGTAPKLRAGAAWEHPSVLLTGSRYPEVYARCFAQLIYELSDYA